MAVDYYHKINPFLPAVNEYLEPVTKILRKEVYLMDSFTHELLTEPGGDNLMRLSRSLGNKAGLSDPQPYVKVFIDGLPLLMKLGVPGLKVLLWILGNLKPKNDQIVLMPVKVAKELGYVATKPVHDGIKDLIAKRIIVRAYTGDRNAPAYWINPTVFYNGNRRHLYNKME